jgi:hemerythrin
MSVIIKISDDAIEQVTKLINAWSEFDQKMLQQKDEKLRLLNETLRIMKHFSYIEEYIAEMEAFQKREYRHTESGPIDVLVRFRDHIESLNGKKVL